MHKIVVSIVYQTVQNQYMLYLIVQLITTILFIWYTKRCTKSLNGVVNHNITGCGHAQKTPIHQTQVKTSCLYLLLLIIQNKTTT